MYTFLCLNVLGVDSCWRKVGNSKTGTCIKLEIDRSPLLSCAEHRSTKDIPALVLTWKGDEPLDRLHICMKVSGGNILLVSRCVAYFPIW